MPHFLLEIGFEEMPARFQPGLAEELKGLVGSLLDQARVEHGEVLTYAAPRRLAVYVPEVAAVTRREEEVVTGPPEKAAYDAAGAPTKAAQGFARGQGVPLEEAFVLDTDKGRYLAVRKTTGGQRVLDLLPEICLESVKRLSFPKKMRWGEREFAFGRPVHWFTALLDDQVIPFEVAGIRSGRLTHGHRIMGPGPFEVPTASDYFGIIREQGQVVIDADERKATVKARAEELAASAGGRAVIDPALLEEVAGLTEHPVVILAKFHEKYLEVPRETLITSMKGHQKSFAVEDAAGRLLPYFLTTLGLLPGDLELVRKGWERVLTARLEDARFFWETDLAADPGAWLAKLDDVVFLAGLGSMGDKSRRLEALCGQLAQDIAPELAADLALAGRLAKADLVSEMVGEFAELQGVMGGIYARRRGQSETVAAAVSEQYLPAGPDSPAPSTLAGAVLAMADKADSLAGCFGLDMAPTGAADPYALRRQALGVIRIVIERDLGVSLQELLGAAFDAYQGASFKVDRTHVLARLLDFFGQRLRAYFLGLGHETVVVDAALGAGFDDVRALKSRLDALAAFSKSEGFERAVLTFKRAANIIRKQGGEAGHPLTGDVKATLLTDPAEKALAEKCTEVFPRFDDLFASGDHPAVLLLLDELRPFVDAFFDNVMVMCEDHDQRLNRLNLLMALVSRLGRMADFAALQV